MNEMRYHGWEDRDGPDPSERGEGAGISMQEIDEYERRKAEKEAAKELPTTTNQDTK